ncbi:MAG: diaminopimelate epimerase [Acidimicrobiia bacterium]|nr:diaminopimelate epimerase [Acidimicrobiia bacterium]
MDFVKMQGLGNDFVVVAGPVEVDAATISAWCDRRRGVGADGVLEVTPIDRTAVRMRYWNADGGPAEMCGNGLRCVARFAFDRGWVDDNEFIVVTPVGPRPVLVRENGSVRVLLGDPRLGADVHMDGIHLHTVDMGNPHAIQWVSAPEEAAVTTQGPLIEEATTFPDGTNAEFAAVTGRDEIEVRVWERGVGETLACGTGAAATAYLAHEQGRVGEKVTMRLRGGTLLVSLEDDGAWIEGPADYVFSGSLY